MTHFSGLPSDLVLSPRWSGYQIGIQRALTTNPVAPPGARFIYSDINFLLLGEIVQRVSGKSLAQFAHEQIFVPLGMNETQFQPPASLRNRIAPTEIDPDTGQPFRGVVHDPTSRFMGGVAGDAGLFTTADELARYAEMMLNMGQREGVRIFEPMTVKKFTEPASPADQPILRGTEMWLDSTTNSFVILLSNVVHPHGVKSLSSLRSRVATAVAVSFGIDVPQTVSLTSYNETITGAGVHRVINRNATTLTGLDALEENSFHELKSKRIGLITNQTALDRHGQRNIDAMLAAGVHVLTLFSPEHGISGTEDSDVSNGKDPQTGIPVVSLYQPNQRRLSADQIRNLDAIVYDIQDVGARFYTYSCTMLYALEAAAKAKKSFSVLDRPNPITGTHVEGPSMQPDLESFTGCYDIPLRHGMTFGELATMANAEQHWSADLHVIRMQNWQRGDWFDTTALTWVNPSPNMRSLNAALLYPGVAMLESNTNYSVGRGTDAPFEQIGADWINGQMLAQYLNSRFIPGARVYPTRFRPSSSNLQGKDLEGIRFVITDREALDSSRLGIEIAAALEKLFPGKIDFEKCRNLIGDRQILTELKSGRDASAIWLQAQEQAAQFTARRKRYLLY